MAAQANNNVARVTCLSASDCWAVGAYNNGVADQTLTEHWDGTSWVIVSSPNTGARQDNVLNGVACASFSNCWAVGRANNGTVDQTLIEHWDGSSWTIVVSPNNSTTQSHVLNAVTCTSATDCVAVGQYYGSTSRWQTLIEHWDGSSWTIAISPNGLIDQHNYLNGLTCVSSSDCWAVGYYLNGLANQTLIEHWNGTIWTMVLSANTDPMRENILSGVTCTSTSDCWAVGSNWTGTANQTLTQHWDGTSWAIVASANTVAQYNTLSEVRCTSASNCWTVGTYNSNSANHTLIEWWNGSSWAIVASPNSSDTVGNTLSGIDCATASNCWAVGWHIGPGVTQTLFESWNGTAWTIVTSPNIDTAETENGLSRVTCLSSSNCWAVGAYYPYGSMGSTPPQNLILHWDGTAWAVFPLPNTDTTQRNNLSAVTCASASDCWAVGSYHASTNLALPAQTLIVRWDGTLWSIVSSPNQNTTADNILSGVTCASARDCWAVGYAVVPGDYQTLIEHWDGSSWTITPSPNHPPGHNELSGVTCRSSNLCWAVGSYYRFDDPGVTGRTLVERWDGHAWTIVDSPNTAEFVHNYLTSVSCPSNSDCWAVGRSRPDSFQTLIEHWDGALWTIVAAPDPGTTASYYLLDVTCPSSSDCWAAGYFDNGTANRTMVNHWDGSSWDVVASPNNNATQAHALIGIACAPFADCWAVGYYSDNYNQILIERYTAPLSLVSAASRKIHGGAGAFEIDLPLSGSPGIECRGGGGLGNHQVAFTFGAPRQCERDSSQRWNSVRCQFPGRER
jgi:hypothetical protein